MAHEEHKRLFEADMELNYAELEGKNKLKILPKARYDFMIEVVEGRQNHTLQYKWRNL